ncbi:MAG: HPr family phosphocarrier protein [Lachnospiraceae bacterium]|nr:HPr family phosphocarrier protein [Lachnospiraceae bacterium]
MSETVISLDSVEKVKKFVSAATEFNSEMDLVSDRYVIDAKSIMGIFSMNLSKPMILRIYEKGEKAEDIMKALEEYVVV